MKLFIVILEISKLTKIKFASMHTGEIVLKPGYEEVNRRNFANRSKAQKYLVQLRKEYTATNLLIDPDYVHPKVRHDAKRVESMVRNL